LKITTRNGNADESTNKNGFSSQNNIESLSNPTSSIVSTPTLINPTDLTANYALNELITLPILPESNKFNTVSFPMNAGNSSNLNNKNDESPTKLVKHDYSDNDLTNPFGVTSAAASD